MMATLGSLQLVRLPVTQSRYVRSSSVPVFASCLDPILVCSCSTFLGQVRVVADYYSRLYKCSENLLMYFALPSTFFSMLVSGYDGVAEV